MSTIITRAGKGSPLSWTEADSNFTNLNTDKLETSSVGVTVQPHSTNLDSFATVTPTSAGLALLDDVNAAAQRVTLDLGNVDNTSDATKNAASVTLTNKTITTPVINTNINFSGTSGAIQVNGVDKITIPATGPVVFINNVQTWQDVTGSRVANTLYTNSTGQPITVLVSGSDPAGWSSIVTVAGLNIAQFGGNNSFGSCTFQVPAGATYKVSTFFLNWRWMELR